MIDEAPDVLLVLLATVLTLGRLWIAVDHSSSGALILRQWGTPRTRCLALAVLALAAFIAVGEDVVRDEH